MSAALRTQRRGVHQLAERGFHCVDLDKAYYAYRLYILLSEFPKEVVL